MHKEPCGGGTATAAWASVRGLCGAPGPQRRQPGGWRRAAASSHRAPRPWWQRSAGAALPPVYTRHAAQYIRVCTLMWRGDCNRTGEESRTRGGAAAAWVAQYVEPRGWALVYRAAVWMHSIAPCPLRWRLRCWPRAAAASLLVMRLSQPRNAAAAVRPSQRSPRPTLPQPQ